MPSTGRVDWVWVAKSDAICKLAGLPCVVYHYEEIYLYHNRQTATVTI